MKFGEILRNLLDERDITQRKLAADLNIAPSTLGNYIRSIREPDFETLKLFASYFDVSTDYLLGYRHTRLPIACINEDELLRIYRSLSREQQLFYLEEGKLLIRMNNHKKSDNSENRDK